EVGDLREKAPDFDLRIGTVIETPKELHDQLFADDRGAVRLLGVDPAYRLALLPRVMREPAGGAELHSPTFGFDRVGRADLLQPRPDQLALRRHVEQRSFARALTYGGERMGIAPLALEPGPAHRERQHVVLGLPVAARLDDRQLEIAAVAVER